MAFLKDRLGEQSYNKQGCSMTIIRYGSAHDVDIQFESGYTARSRCYFRFQEGAVKDVFVPSVYCLGYLGGDRYSNRSHSKIYDKWTDMFKRCYSKERLKKYVTYEGCLVHEFWHNFQNFAKWYEENFKSWMNKNWHLDKDILIKNNKIYSPDNCSFVPREINALFIKRENLRGDYPIGVSLNKVLGKFSATCNRGNKRNHIGFFTTPEAAFQAYKQAKEDYIKEVAEKWRGKIDERVYQAMINYQVEITD